MIHYSLPRETFQLLEETLGSKEKAEVFAATMEEFLSQVDEKTHTMAVDKLDHIRAQLKDDLADTFITREYLDRKIAYMDEKFKRIDDRFDHLEEKFTGSDKQLDVKFTGMFEHLDAKFTGMFEHLDAKFTGMFEHLDAKFTGMFDHLDAKFTGMFDHLDEKFTVKFKQLETKVDDRFKNLDFKFNILIGVAVIGLTLANSSFLDLIRYIFR